MTENGSYIEKDEVQEIIESLHKQKVSARFYFGQNYHPLTFLDANYKFLKITKFYFGILFKIQNTSNKVIYIYLNRPT